MTLHCQTNAASQKGFTLIEVLIAMVLLVIISLAIYQATTETYRLRDVLMHEGDFYNSIRLSMGVMDRDVSLIFSPTMMLPTPRASFSPEQSSQMEEIARTDQGQTTQFWGGAVDPSGIRPSHFIGSETKMSFISVSHIRLYKESTESEFAKIIYELKPNTDPLNTLSGTHVLIKGESPNAFEEDTPNDKSFTYYPLLRGISKLQFRYFHKAKDQWLTSWDSDKEDLKNIYPDRIEVNLEVKGPSRLFFEGIYQMKPEIPIDGLLPTT